MQNRVSKYYIVGMYVGINFVTKLVILEMTFMKHWGTIINFVLFAFICLIICIAVWMLSGDIQNWMKLVIYAITFAILFPLIRYIKRIRVNHRDRFIDPKE